MTLPVVVVTVFILLKLQTTVNNQSHLLSTTIITLSLFWQDYDIFFHSCSDGAIFLLTHELDAYANYPISSTAKVKAELATG